MKGKRMSRKITWEYVHNLSPAELEEFAEEHYVSLDDDMSHEEAQDFVCKELLLGMSADEEGDGEKTGKQRQKRADAQGDGHTGTRINEEVERYMARYKVSYREAIN